MLYIEGDTSDTWPRASRVLAGLEHLRMVIQLYDEDCSVPPPFQQATSPQWLDSVTRHSDGERDCPSVSSDPVDADDALLEAVKGMAVDEAECELDFALFRPGERDWIAAAVPHESMVLVRDDSLFDALADAGLVVESQPPTWW